MEMTKKPAAEDGRLPHIFDFADGKIYDEATIFPLLVQSRRSPTTPPSFDPCAQPILAQHWFGVEAPMARARNTRAVA